MRQLFHFIRNPQAGFVDLDDSRQVDGRGDQNQVAGHAVDRLFQFMPLHHAVAHRRQKMDHVWIAVKRAANGTDSKRFRARSPWPMATMASSSSIRLGTWWAARPLRRATSYPGTKAAAFT